MDMDHMHDMGIGSDINYAFARDYWYIAAGVVGLLVAVRGVNHIGARQRLKACHDPTVKQPTRPDGALSQAWATTTAIIRELSLPQLYIPTRGLRWATPPPLGRVLFLLCYWAVIVAFMSWHAVIKDVYFWERIGYRNAWVTIMQLPMLYLLSMKLNPIAWLVGSSHERINWLHRWIARTMFVTATVHGFHFWTEWVLADFVEYELSIMPLVRYGLGAWGVLLWSVVVGFLPIRRLAYEVWLLQHIVSSVVMLWLLYKHIPATAQYLLWMSISFLVFDRAARWLLLFWQNTRWGRLSTSSCQGMKRIGHGVSLRAMGDSVTAVTIKDVHFQWHAGQHVYLWIPRLGPVEAHPYTIANAHQIKGTCCCGSIQLIVRAHGGFSKRLHNYATRHPERVLTGFLSGPYGAPPQWDVYETIVLIGASTGASFTIPILEYVAAASHRTCVKKMEVILTARTAEELSYYIQRAKEAGKDAREKGIEVRLHVAITGAYSEGESGVPLVRLRRDDSSRKGHMQLSSYDEKTTDIELRDRSTAVDQPGTSSGCCCRRSNSSATAGSLASDASIEYVREYSSRPDIEALIREPVERAWGETAVVVCGGKELVARTRNCVSRLSDERAVHKGTGAQGIYLHVEEYAF
ncbi:metalloreductase [Purpureocillium lilacinum]|uniref:ferric-chelate reductase (NADPH) n=2 Tax=Purpureocillium lilacinum TaxID=33203 RepID=A0A179HU39_PURLI|nr:metalloreductase [Purpureocillium lilacinum]OAQ94006.1 metalloreductase [Purpureocillium lilacinum]PWI70193.1 putative ferric reductase [Purpureocillium lilacinum]